MCPLLLTANEYPLTPNCGEKKALITHLGAMLVEPTLKAGVRRTISLIGTSIPATPKRFADRTYK